MLVNNVGAVRPRPGGFLSVTDDDWTWPLLINFMAAVRSHAGGAAAPHRAARHDRDDVARSTRSCPTRWSSTTARRRPHWPTSPRRCPRRSARRGVRVNTVSPGPVATDLWLGDDGVAATVAQAGGVNAGRRRRSRRPRQPSPAGSPPPQEVADLVVLLASGRAGNVTGADFVIDGGLVQTL